MKDTELRTLTGLSTEFPGLVAEIARVGQEGYQEALTALLWEDTIDEEGLIKLGSNERQDVLP